jgi:isovaleryl-CoA dehydrogenase
MNFSTQPSPFGPLTAGTSQHEALRQRFFAVGRDLVRPGAAARDAGGGWDRELWRQVGATGLFGLHLPPAFGGEGRSIEEAAAAFAGFAAGCEDVGFLVSVVSHVGLVQSSLRYFGSVEQQTRWLPGLIRGELLGCFGITEKHAGSDVRALQLRACPDAAGGWRLEGSKWNITNAPMADLSVVFARLEGQRHPRISAFLVELSKPGARRSAPAELMGNRTTPVGELLFDGAAVTERDLLGGLGRGLRVLDFAFQIERVLTGIAAIGCLESLIEHCLDWTEQREAFGRPIGEFQYVQGHIVEIATSLELIRGTAWRALEALIAGRECGALASVVKMAAAEAFHQAAIGALRLHGSHGYRRGSPIERLCRDAAGILLAGGTAEIHKRIIWQKLRQQRTATPIHPRSP